RGPRARRRRPPRARARGRRRRSAPAGPSSPCRPRARGPARRPCGAGSSRTRPWPAGTCRGTRSPRAGAARCAPARGAARRAAPRPRRRPPAPLPRRRPAWPRPAGPAGQGLRRGSQPPPSPRLPSWSRRSPAAPSARGLEVGVDDLFVVALAALLRSAVSLGGLRRGRLHEGPQLLGELVRLAVDLVLRRAAVEGPLRLVDRLLQGLLLVLGGAGGVVEGLLRLQPEAVELVLGLGQLARLAVLLGELLGLLHHPVHLVLAQGRGVLDGD